jgi:serine phosphatase RsbU (regulator of sigma subunit)
MKIQFPFRRKAPQGTRMPFRAEFPVLAGLQIAASYSGARMGGDFFDVVQTPNGRVLLVLMDIAGLRDSALDIAAQAQEVFRERAAELFAHDGLNESDAIAELTLILNRAVLAAANGPRCSPAFVASYAPAMGTLTYVNAGHMPGFVVDAKDILLLSSNGLPLGLFSHVVHDAQVCVLGEGDAFVIASRGVAECSASQDDFGIDGIQKALAEASRQSANELCEVVLKMAQQYSGRSCSPVNDMTALALLRETRAKAQTPTKVGEVA